MMKSQPLLSVLSLALWFVSASAAIAADGADSAPIRRVLVVYENESTLPAMTEIAAGVRKGIEARLPARFELYSEYLDSVRFPSPDRLRVLATTSPQSTRTSTSIL
jgi:hypothetical protein